MRTHHHSIDHGETGETPEAWCNAMRAFGDGPGLNDARQAVLRDPFGSQRLTTVRFGCSCLRKVARYMAKWAKVG